MVQLRVLLEFTGLSTDEVAKAISRLHDGAPIKFVDEVFVLELDSHCNRYDIGEWILYTGVGVNDYMVLDSPILNTRYIQQLFDIIVALKAMGAYVLQDCSIQILVGSVLDKEKVLDRYKLQQDDLYKEWAVNGVRQSRFCMKYTEARVSFTSPSSLFYGLSLYKSEITGFINFRLFNSTLERREIIKMLDWVGHFAYGIEEYSNYYPVFADYLRNY